jgi:hypothetical protein
LRRPDRGPRPDRDRRLPTRGASRPHRLARPVVDELRRTRRTPLGNLAVAQQLAGDSAAAKATVELALGYAPDEAVLLSNLAALEARRIAASTTAGNVK